MGTERRYKAYLVRLWQTGRADAATWRASVEDAHTGARYSFANLEMLFAFLDSQTHSATVRERASDETTGAAHTGGISEGKLDDLT